MTGSGSTAGLSLRDRLHALSLRRGGARDPGRGRARRLVPRPPGHAGATRVAPQQSHGKREAGTGACLSGRGAILSRDRRMRTWPSHRPFRSLTPGCTTVGSGPDELDDGHMMLRSGRDHWSCLAHSWRHLGRSAPRADSSARKAPFLILEMLPRGREITEEGTTGYGWMSSPTATRAPPPRTSR